METFNVGPEGIFIAAKRKYGLPDHIIRERILPVVQEYNAIEDLNRVRADTRYAWPPMEAYGFQPSQLSRSAEIPTFGFEGIRDVRGEAARETAAAQVARARQLDASEGSLQKEWANTNKLVTFTNMLTGGNTSLLPPLKSARGATAASQKKSEVALANEKFFNDLMAFSVQAGGRITGDQLRDFINDSGAGLAQVKALEASKMFKHMDLGSLVPMYWVENNDLKMSWHFNNDVLDIQYQRELGKVMKKEDAKYKRELNLEASVVTVTEAARDWNDGKGIRTHEDFKKFREEYKSQLTKSPLIMSSLKNVIPDSVWIRGQMEMLFKKDEKGNITSSEFEVGSKAYNDALASGKWFKTAENTNLNAEVQARKLFIELTNDNKGLSGSALKIKFLSTAQQRGIRSTADFKLGERFEKWWDQGQRDKEKIENEKTNLGQYLSGGPPSVERWGNIQKVLASSGSEAQKWFMDQFNMMYEYPKTEPRVLYNPTTGEPSPSIFTWGENFQYRQEGFTSEERLDTRPIEDKRKALQHKTITEAIKEVGDADTYRYFGQGLSPEEYEDFTTKFEEGVERFTPKGQREYNASVRKAIEPIVGGDGGLNNLNSEIQAIVASARQGGGGQIAFLQRVQRLFDPGGVVREGDVHLMSMLDSEFDRLGVAFNRAFNDETRVVSNELIAELEAAAYIYWRIRTDYLRDQLRSAEIDYDENTLPQPYEKGGPEYMGWSATEEDPVYGEGVKRSWDATVGNNVIKLQDRDNFDPYIAKGWAPLKGVGEEYQRLVKGVGQKKKKDKGLENMSAKDIAKSWGFSE